MSVSDTAVAAAAVRRMPRRSSATRCQPTTRRSADVIIAAYRQYADLIARDIFSPYLADLLDLDKHARHGHLLVVEADGRIRGFGAFYPDASVQGLGWPPGWAGGRALAVHPDARGHGVARALLAAVRAPRPRVRRAGVRVPHGQLHDRRHRPVRAARLPPGTRVRLRHGRPLRPVRRRADHVDRLPAPTGASTYLLGGSDDHQHSYPAGQLTRLLPGPPGGPLAGRVLAAAAVGVVVGVRAATEPRPADRASCTGEARGPAADLVRSDKRRHANASSGFACRRQLSQPDQPICGCRASATQPCWAA